MTAYATPEELARHMGRGDDGFDEAETLRAQDLLEEATGTIVDEVGQDLIQSETTVVCDGTGTCKLVLPRHPVTAVASVTVTDADGTVTELVERTDYTWNEAGVLTRRGGVWPALDRAVEVVYTPGFSKLPTNVVRICKRLAASSWNNPAGADSEDIGDSRVRWSAPGGELTTGEKTQLDPYRANR